MNKAVMTLVFVGNGTDPVAAFQYADLAERWANTNYPARIDVKRVTGQIQWTAGISATTPAALPANMQCLNPPPHVLLECINDELHIIRRLLGKPEDCMNASEIMDVLRMAVELRSQSLRIIGG